MQTNIRKSEKVKEFKLSIGIPKFSIVVIAKNEAKTLPRLLSSLKEFLSLGGEIIVLDTGSTDDTVKVARAGGCKVTEVGNKFIEVVNKTEADDINKKFIVEGEEKAVSGEEKYFNFGAARNFAASLASNDMVSMPDCDEEFTKLDIEKINNVILSGIQQIEFNFVFSHDIYGKESCKFIQCKFYNRTLMHWVGIIHEVLSGSANRLLLGEDILKIEHWQNPETGRSGYIKGLAIDCFRNLTYDRNSHYFARELMWNGRPKSAIKEFERHIAMNAWVAERAQSMIFIGDCYGMLNLPDKQVEWYQKAFNLDGTRRESLIKLAYFYRHHNNPQAAACYAAASLQIKWSGYYAEDHTHYTNTPHEILYWARGWLGDIPGSQEHIMKALEHQPHNPQYLRDTKYYFGYPDNGIEGWMQYPELQWLNEMAKKMDSIAELGSFKGRSTHALLSGCKGKVYAIDHFQGSVEEVWASEYKPENTKDDAIYKQFSQNVGHFSNLVVNKKSSSEAVKDYPDKSFDMVFIDACHTYEGVKADILAWKNKAKILLCGHDYCDAWAGVKQAVNEAFGSVDVHGSIWYKWINQPKVSIIIPTLGRPEKLHRLVSEIKRISGYSNYEVIVKVDDFPPNNTGVPKLLKQGVEESTGELVMYLGNDCIPQKDFLQLAVFRMIKEFPDMDGLIGLNDGYWAGEFATHWLASKKLLPYLDGEFFHTGYYHCGCDNELTERCRKIGKYVWAEESYIIHDHPVQRGFTPDTMDDVYRLAYDKERTKKDQDLLTKRSQTICFDVHRNFGSPRKLLEPVPSCNLISRLPQGYKNMSILNVGIEPGNSGVACQIPFLRCKKITNIDVYEPYLENGRKQIWDSPVEFVKKNILEIDNFKDYDLVFLFDILEHIPKEDGLSILKKIIDSSTKILIMCPIEPQLMNNRKDVDNIPSQDHVSLWTKEDFINCGFDVETLPNFHNENGVTFDSVWAKKYITSPINVESIRNIFAQKIVNGENFIYTKLGDGEIACINGETGHNCDGQQYSKSLSKDLKESFKFMSTIIDSHFAVWSGCEDIAIELGITTINAAYSYVFLHHEGQGIPINLYKTIQSSNRKKIFIRPIPLLLADDFLKSDLSVTIKGDNAYADVNNVIKYIKSHLVDNCIVLICAGLASKVIMAKALKINPNITCLDLGSGLDNLFHKVTRFSINSDPKFPGQIPTDIVRKAYGL